MILSLSRGKQGYDDSDHLGFLIISNIHIEPKVSMLHHHCRTLPVEHPDPTKNGPQSNAMRIYGPQFDRRRRRGLLHLLERLGEFF